MRRQASSVRRYGQSHTLVGNARFGGEGDGVATRLLPSVVRAFAALLLGVSSAAFEFFTGSELQAFCDSPNWDEKNPSVCFGARVPTSPSTSCRTDRQRPN